MSDERFNNIDAKLDKIESHLNSIDKTLVRQEEQISVHIRRTNILEEKLQPVEDHVKFIQKLVKLVIGIVAFAGSIAALIRYLN